MTTAVNVLIVVPLSLDMFFQLCFRATTNHCSGGATWLKQALLSSVVLPATAAFAATIG
eukprot:SAG11_NODE_30494_length_300_cov_1.029851_1_plen_58_part_01